MYRFKNDEPSVRQQKNYQLTDNFFVSQPVDSVMRIGWIIWKHFSAATQLRITILSHLRHVLTDFVGVIFQNNFSKLSFSRTFFVDLQPIRPKFEKTSTKVIWKTHWASYILKMTFLEFPQKKPYTKTSNPIPGLWDKKRTNELKIRHFPTPPLNS